MKRKKKNQKVELTDSELIATQLERFRPLLSQDEYKLVEKIVDQPLIPSIRLNPLKSDTSIVANLQRQYGWTLTPIPFCPSGFRVGINAGPAISDTIEYQNGCYYIQEASSMLPVELFHFDSSEDYLTLDLAASPGGKTTHLSSRMQDKGLIIANDSSQGRIQALRIVLQNWGTENTAVTRFPGESFGRWFPDTFDRVLIDAPCSMQGLRTAESHPPRPVTPKETRDLARRQVDLLTSAINAAKIGGEIVYSTCTLSSEEDEGVIETILEEFGDAITLENAQSILPMPAPGISITEDAVEKSLMANTIRLWPHRYDTAGFFACLLKKNRSIIGKSEQPPSHSMNKAGFFELTLAEQQSLSAKFEELYGFPMENYIKDHQRTLLKRDERIYIVPQVFMQEFSTLPVQYVGLHLCSIEPEGITPSFAWCTRFGLQCRKALINLDENEFAQWLKGLDIPATQSRGGKSAIHIVTDPIGRFIGRGKRIQGMLKNLDSKYYR
jgi:16S rRNA (cytosine1407-C5)-methyltransferase